LHGSHLQSVSELREASVSGLISMAPTLLLGSQLLSSTFGSFSPSHHFSPFKGVFC